MNSAGVAAAGEAGAALAERGARRGRPSFVWGFGQERRFQMMLPLLADDPAPVLDIGCGVGVYLRRFRRAGIASLGVDLEWEHLCEAVAAVPAAAAHAGTLPFADDTFGTVLLHEVIEHFDNDAGALREAVRVTRLHGRVLVFAPNRLYPFETHGIYLGRRYIFGNIPLVHYLPGAVRRHLSPHVRSYTDHSLRGLWRELPVRVCHHVQVYPGYDKISRRRPQLASLARVVTYLLERTPLRHLGLSHFVVLEKTGELRSLAVEGDE